MAMSAAHLEELRQAHQLLEHPGFAIRVAHVLGKPLEVVLERLPSAGRTAIAAATEKALRVTLDGALATMKRRQDDESPVLHKLFATATGAAGGFFGLAALPIELPISTGVLFRAIADVARANGEDLAQTEVRLECLKVFAMGGPSPSDDASETGYLAVRASMARLITEAADYLAAYAVAEEAAPVLARLIAAIAARFQVQVAEKVAAQAVPVIGAIAGGSINYLFVSHFQEMSRGHFTFRRLSRVYGVDEVTRQYQALSASAPTVDMA